MLRRLGLIAGTLFALGVTLELLFRALPVSTSTDTGYHVDPHILGYPPGHRWRVATGWDLRNAQTLQANNLGFAASRDFVPDPRAVALIGDSFIESSMLVASQRPGAQLEAALGNRPVYAMGGPGSSLLDYADRVRLARERLKVSDVVVMLESGDVRQSICGSGNVHSACLAPVTLEPRRERLPPPGALKRWVRHSALAQYLFSQLKVRPEQWLKRLQASAPAASTGRGVIGLDERSTRAVVDTFFERVGPLQGGERLIVVVDGSRDQTGKPLDPSLAAERATFIAEARRWGAVVVDAEPLYLAHRAGSKRSVEVGPYDTHLNGMGVALLMKAAAQRLQRAQ